ncbi:MAG: mannose-1-phosphate guanylyltransferase [Candidatus Cloacimonetes bacterium]|nr:mannose-1-phosphate guanylyltransferase [Candidatus Cloacimonadota bacterium]
MVGLILAGGTGTRFWPASRESLPKQFLTILGNKSMIRMTVDRLLMKMPIDKIYVSTTAAQVSLVKNDIPELPNHNIIIEPMGMNTAPCIGLSLRYLKRFENAKETVIILPADHLIKDEKEFLHSIELAETPAREGYHVTFGIIPEYPATGYGYIEAGKSYSSGMFHVKQFKEKPDHVTAKFFIEQGNFYWNSGQFCWTIETINNSFRTKLPLVDAILNEIEKVWDESGIDANISHLYERMPRIPVDIGIMEQVEKRVVIPVEYGWSDVGSWRALADLSQKDINGNTFFADHISLDSRNNYIRTDKFVAVIDVDELIVVETEDAILITNRKKAELVKNVVNKLKEEKKDKLL